MGGVGSGKSPRQYPEDIVELTCRLYESGMTVREVGEAIPSGYKAQRILERYLPQRRSAIRRDQAGPANHMWRNDPGYQAAHLRLGKAADLCCVDCGAGAHDWSYQHGCPEELKGRNGCSYCTHPEHYRPRCRKCHRAYDRKGAVSDV